MTDVQFFERFCDGYEGPGDSYDDVDSMNIDLEWDDVTEADVLAQLAGAAWRGVSEQRHSNGTVYQFSDEHEMAELTAKGWAALFSTEGR